MITDEDEIPQEPSKSMPAWVMTFADLMSLLMCFFVLLLSFSEMDLLKFKQVAGSMEKAFGVQRIIDAKEPPRGTSIIAQEFSPGKPEPTPLNEVRQMTTLEVEEMLKIDKIEKESKTNGDEGENASHIAEQLKESLRDGLIEVESKENKVVIRILEKGSFNSGSANIKLEFLPTLKKLADVIANIDGKITIAGYTDNIPIQNDMFRSNWELSAIRAFAVLNELLKHPKLHDERFVLQGHGANEPIASNSTIFTRAKNRRVELTISQGSGKKEENKEELFTKDKDYRLAPSLDGVTGLDVSPFPAVRQVTKTGGKDEENGNLGVFDEHAIYDYELQKEKAKTKVEHRNKDKSQEQAPASKAGTGIQELKAFDGIELPDQATPAKSLPLSGDDKPTIPLLPMIPSEPPTTPKIESEEFLDNNANEES